jgi:hypothetical protein
MITKLWLEMPYVYAGKDKIFDLEFEQFSDTKSMLTYIRAILLGKKCIDKHNNEIRLITHQDKTDFIEYLDNDKIFQTIFNNKFTSDEKEMWNEMIKRVYDN